MRFLNWIKDHRVQAMIGLLALVVAVLALLRDLTNYSFDRDKTLAPTPTAPSSVEPRTEAPAIENTSAPSREEDQPAARRGPVELRMTGGQITGTEIDLDSEAPNWDVNNCASACDINFRGSLNGIEEAHGQMAEAQATYESCQAATTYGFTIGPRQANAGLQACVRTDEGRIAGIVVGKVKRSDPDHVESITLTVTVWES
jgi:hypothetical protein